MSACTRCGAAAQPQAQFCSACGGPVAHSVAALAPTAASAPEPQVRAPAYVRPAGQGYVPPEPVAAPLVSGARPPVASSPGLASMPVPAGAVVFDPAAFRVHWAPDSLRGFLVAYGASGLNARGESWPLHGGRYALGRVSVGDPSEIVLSDGTISTRHAVLSVDGTTGLVTLEDLRSTNGTFVNEDPLLPSIRRALRDGDRVRFGGYTTVVKLISKV